MRPVVIDTNCLLQIIALRISQFIILYFEAGGLRGRSSCFFNVQCTMYNDEWGVVEPS